MGSEPMMFCAVEKAFLGSRKCSKLAFRSQATADIAELTVGSTRSRLTQLRHRHGDPTEASEPFKVLV
jgi:hypothetical protein